MRQLTMKFYGFILAVVIGKASCATVNPVFAVGVEDYAITTDPSSTQGYQDTNQRATAYWPLNCDTAAKTCAGWELSRASAIVTRNAPPALKPYPDGNLDWLHVDYPGPQAHPLISSTADATDRAVRFPGRNKSCLIAEEGNSAYDKCLLQPASCELVVSEATMIKGLSFSLWAKLPQEFMTEPRYLLDTGANEKGGAGVAVYFVGSTDGVRFSHQLTVMVSTGNKYWKVVVNGMTRPYAWNNIGVRWSGDLQPGTNIPYGLWVYINGTKVASKYYETALTGNEVPSPTSAEFKMTLGCKLDGSRPFLGVIDNLAVWYWYINEAESIWFDGALTFTKQVGTTDITDEGGLTPTGSLMPGGFVPWQYMEEQMRLATEASENQAYVDDVVPAKEGDCLVGDTSTWGDGGDDNKPHPVDCADTRIELQSALELDNEYSGHELVKAIVRTCNKAGEKGLSLDDIMYVWHTAFQAAYNKLAARITLDTQVTGLTYSNIMVAMSKMQEKVYDALWDQTITTDKRGGLITFLYQLDNFLLVLAEKFILIGNAPAIVQSSNNHSVAIAVKVRQKDVKNALVFPDYALLVRKGNDTEPYYSFPLKRKGSWGLTTDFIRLPKEAMQGSYTDTTTEIRVTAKLYNRMAEHIPGIMYNGVQGIEGATFFMNSRMISISMNPEPETPDALIAHPVEFVLEHIKQQPDAPYKKGAVLCAYWKHLPNDSYGGAWDTLGCTLDATNDTHTVCKCNHMTDFAVLLEDYTPPGRLPEAMYIICYVLYAISILLLLIFMFFVLYADRLHYEVHIVHWNCALALVLALGFYLMTIWAKSDRLWCMVISVFVHYSYTAAYLWLTFCAHYVFRAITSGKLGGRILTWYSYLGWGGPAVMVTILILIDVSRYGIGDRCLGAHNDYFLWFYIGLFLLFCFMTCPLVIIAIVNLSKSIIKDPIDRQDITWSLWGLAIIWPFIFLVWIWAIFVYLIPLGVQVIDFLFEFFNSLHGILFFIVFGLLVPSARLTLRTAGKADGRIRGGFEAEELYPPVEQAVSDWTPPDTSDGSEKKKKKKKKDIEPVLEEDKRRDHVRHKVFVPYITNEGKF